MGVLPRIPPLYRDICLAVFALSLLVTPVWLPLVDLNEPSYEYDRAQVGPPDGTEFSGPIGFSEDIVDCTRPPFPRRVCAFEADVLDESVPVDEYGRWRLDPGFAREDDEYEYVQLRDAIYEPTFVTNSSASDDRQKRTEMTLEPVDPETVLEDVAIDVSDDTLSPVVATTARDGPTTTRERIDVPENPIALADGTYYRVYLAETEAPRSLEGHLEFLLTYHAPVAGFFGLVFLSRRVDVSYVGDDGP